MIRLWTNHYLDVKKVSDGLSDLHDVMKKQLQLLASTTSLNKLLQVATELGSAACRNRRVRDEVSCSDPRFDNQMTVKHLLYLHRLLEAGCKHYPGLSILHHDEIKLCCPPPGAHHKARVYHLVGLPLGQVRLPVLGLYQGRRLVREVGSVVIIAQVGQQLTTLLRICQSQVRLKI